MAVSDILINASRTDWTLTKDFEFFYIQNSKFNKFQIQDFINSEEPIQDIYSKCTMSVDVPQLTASEMDSVLGGERRTNIKMQELFRFSAKFRDFNSLALRDYFKGLWTATHFEYPADIAGSVYILHKNKLVFHSDNVTINSVSAIQFDTTSTQIAEFDVQFLSPTYSDSSINNFGKSDYVDRFQITAEQQETSVESIPDRDGGVNTSVVTSADIGF